MGLNKRLEMNKLTVLTAYFMCSWAAFKVSSELIASAWISSKKNEQYMKE